MGRNKTIALVSAIFLSILLIITIVFVSTNTSTPDQPSSGGSIKVTASPEAESKPLDAGKLSWMLPLEYRNAEVIPHDSQQDSGRYNGVDYIVPAGTEVYSIGIGKVRTTGLHAFYGERLIVDYVINDQLITILYANLSSEDVFVKAGDTVTGGQTIALVGSTGESVPRLHIEVRIVGAEVYPVTWLDDNIPVS